ncbi:HlyD family efflux transporter periplasmic adaptor subunit [Paracoccus zhejiangensis]|uniref:HlyD family secretion protein n=1 Tax=Paracoccus zhejiangensis TaxID=1077935 RepID=A0A2H5F1X5_9RHOB|nr:HlyD family secretion protein [Paracoccus zhejiangensis]AUH65550.1 HlyD family secretion protein [Paracoccus zhejiangensis]
MKYGRLIIGIVAVITALWIILGEQMSGASADAVVNAPVVTVRAPVAGNLQMPARQLGSRVSRGEVLASLQDPIVDRIRLDDLLMEARLEAAAEAQIAALLSETQSIREHLAEQTRSDRARRLEELREHLSHAEARLTILETGGVTLENEDQQLLDAVAQDADRLPGEPRLDALVLDHARERVDVLRIALRAAEENVFLRDGNDAGQRLRELDKDIAILASHLAEAQERSAAVRERADRERIRVNGLTGGDLQAPVDGLFWEVLEADSVTVQRGDPLLRLVDCQATLVTVSVTERVYNGLTVGQAATFRLGGTSEVLDATISRLAGSGAAAVYRSLAVAPSQRHLERYDVALIVPALRQAGPEGCMIGRTGRAFFETRPLDGLRNLFR